MPVDKHHILHLVKL